MRRLAKRRLSAPILSQGFRPFFLGGALWASIVVHLWLLTLPGWLDLPIAVDVLAWHQHEMLFGFASAIIAGFLLTAIPNWTGRLPVSGLPLAALFGLWLAGRLIQVLSAVVGAATAAIVDLSFLMLLTLVASHEIIVGGNRRNIPVVGLIGLLATANILFHAEQLTSLDLDSVGVRLAMASIAMLIAVIGGRIAPSFTRNWLAKQGAATPPAAFGRFDRFTLFVSAAALLGFVIAPDAWPIDLLLAIAGALHLARLSRWRGLSTLREPLVWVLHVGYLWLAIGIALLGLTELTPGLDRLSGTHALTAGGFGTMMLAVMTRASLGHSGRALAANRLTIAIYLAVSLGALGRTASNFAPGSTWLAVSGVLWASAFLLFALGYGPLLWRANKAQA